MVQIGGRFLKIESQNIGVEPCNFGTVKKHPNLPQYKFFRSFGQKKIKMETKFHSQPLNTRSDDFQFSSTVVIACSLDGNKDSLILFNQCSIWIWYFSGRKSYLRIKIIFVCLEPIGEFISEFCTWNLNFWDFRTAHWMDFSKNHKILFLGRLKGADKLAKNEVGTVFWDTL